MVFSKILHIVVFLKILSDSQCSGEVISTSLYCGFENSFYKVGETWSDSCNDYNCTSDGVFAQPIQECELPAERERTEWCTPVVEQTDRQSCCTEEVFCQELELPPHGTDPANSEPPTTFTCPDGWTDVMETGEVRQNFCVKKFEEPATFEEAKQTCRSNGAFLINMDNEELLRKLLSDFGQLFPADKGTFWTGAHYNGRIFLWDGVIPTLPRLEINCPASPFVARSNTWKCGYEEEWLKLDGSPCIAAKVTSYTGAVDGVVSSGNSTQYILPSCQEKHEYICVGNFMDENNFELITSKLCDEGWEWNPLTRICIKYVKSSEAMPNYFAALEHCEKEGGSLYITNTTEKEFLLYEVMKSREIKPYSIWVGEGCQEMINPYIFGTTDLKSIKRPVECYQTLPYVCEKRAKPSNEFTYKATLVKESNNIRCALDGQRDETYRILNPDRRLTPEVVLSSPIAPNEAGPYMCIAWSKELLDHVYSDVLNEDGGSTHPLVITVPLNGTSFQGWHNMVQYYEFRRRDLQPTLNSIQDKVNVATNQALQRSLDIISNPDLCDSCLNRFVNENTRLSMRIIKHVSEWEGRGVMVIGLGVFYVEARRLARQVAPLEVNSSVDNWAILDKYMRESLIIELGLNSNEEYLVQVLQSGRCPGEDRYITELNVNITLPLSPLYKTIELSLCGFTGDPIVSATCGDNGGGGQWSVTVNPCGDDEDTTETTKMLRTLSLTEIKKENVLDVLKSTSNAITSDSSAADITYAAEILNNVEGISLESDQTEPFFESFTESINKLLNVGDEAVNKAQAEAGTSIRILAAVDILATIPIALSASGINIFQTVKENFAYRLTTQQEIFGVMLRENTLNEQSVTYANNSVNDITVNNDKEVGLFLRREGLAETRRAFAVYGKKKFHRSTEVLKSVDHVISATVTQTDGQPIDLANKFNDLVSLHFPQTLIRLDKQLDSSKLECGFWELEEAVWSTDGCITTIDENGVTCSCDHLTDFSVLLDIRRDGTTDTDNGIHRKILSVISYVGLSISIAALGLVVLTAVMYSRFRKTNSQKVLAFLAASLLGRDITFVVGIERTETYGGCVAVAVFLHYFVLISFAWMFVEGIIQYLRFVKVFGTYIPRFMLKAIIPSFGIPLIIIIITLAIDVDLYKASDEFCWLKIDAIYYAVLLPIGLVLLANIVVYVLAVRSLYLSRRRIRSHQTSELAKKTEILHLIACISIFVVLGLTWVFGYFALIDESASIAFQYLFCIFNSLQGVLIFVFHNVRQPAVRQAWRDLCCCREKKSYSTGTTGADNHRVNKEKQPMNRGPGPVIDDSSF